MTDHACPTCGTPWDRREAENSDLRRLLDARTEALRKIHWRSVQDGFETETENASWLYECHELADKALSLTTNDFAAAPAQHEEE